MSEAFHCAVFSFWLEWMLTFTSAEAWNEWRKKTNEVRPEGKAPRLEELVATQSTN